MRFFQQIEDAKRMRGKKNAPFTKQPSTVSTRTIATTHSAPETKITLRSQKPMQKVVTQANTIGLRTVC